MKKLPAISDRILVDKVSTNLESIEVFSIDRTSANASSESCQEKKKKFSREQGFTLACLPFGQFAVGLCFSLQGPFFPKEAEMKGLSSTEIGFVFGIYEITSFLFATLMGKLVVKVGPKNVLTCGKFFLGFAVISFGLLDYLDSRAVFITLALFIRSCEGIARSAGRVSILAIVSSRFPDRVNTIFAITQSCLVFGVTIGSVIGGALYQVGGYGLPFYAVGSLVLIDGVCTLFLLPNSETEKSNSSANFTEKKILLHPETIAFLSVIFITSYILTVNEATLEPHIRPLDLSVVQTGLIFSLRGIMLIATSPISGWLCDKNFSPNILSIVGCFMFLLAILFIDPLPYFRIEINVEMIAVALAVMGIGMAFVSGPSLRGLINCSRKRAYPDDISTFSLVSSLYAKAQSFGSFAGPSLGGYLTDAYGYGVSMLVLFLSVLTIVTILILVSWLNKDTRYSVSGKPSSGSSAH